MGTQASQKKKKKSTAVGWSRSGRWALRAPAPLYQAGFSAPTTHIIKAIGGWSQKEVNIDPRAASCFAKKWRVWNAHGAETCVPAERRQSTAMQTAERGGDRRAHLLRDRRRVLLLLVYFFFLCYPTKQYRPENYNSRDKQVKCDGPCLVLSLPFKHPNNPPKATFGPQVAFYHLSSPIILQLLSQAKQYADKACTHTYTLGHIFTPP